MSIGLFRVEAFHRVFNLYHASVFKDERSFYMLAFAERAREADKNRGRTPGLELNALTLLNL
jgi:hypothetical protein